MTRRVVVTGGAGFVGSSLCDHLLARGCEVVAIDNLCTGRRSNVAHLAGRPDFRLIEADVSLPFEVDGPVTDILHFASPASPFDYLALPLETLAVGSSGTCNALALAHRKGARFLLASTSEVYGDPAVHPQREDYNGNVSCTGPRSVYDEAKRFAEAATMAWRRTHAVDTRIIRIFNTYGPRMKAFDGRVVPAFVCQALMGEKLTVFGDGHQTRSFCYVDDLVAGILTVLDHGDENPYNLGNPDEFTILEFVDEIRRQLGPIEVEYRPLPVDDPTRRQPDITRARGLGWQPRIALREGLANTIQAFKDRMARGPIDA